MFKKLLNVGKGHSAADKLQQQQQLEQQKNLFQLNEIRSYGFSHLTCLGYSPSLSLLAVGSKFGLLRVLGNASVEFSYQLESNNSIRQIEFIDCRSKTTNQQSSSNKKNSKVNSSHSELQQQLDKPTEGASAKIVLLTDNGQLHLFELKTCKQTNYTDNTTQTDNGHQQPTGDCCQQQQSSSRQGSNDQLSSNVTEYTKLERVAILNYFIYNSDEEDRSKRITTLEISADSKVVFVGTEGGNVYQVPLDKFESLNQATTTTTTTTSRHDQQEHKQVQDKATSESTSVQKQSSSANEQVSEKVESAQLKSEGNDDNDKQSTTKDDETTDVNLNDEPQIQEDGKLESLTTAQAGQEEEGEEQQEEGPFETIKFEENVAKQLGDDIKAKKQGAIESIKRHPSSSSKLLLSYHRGLNVIYDVQAKQVNKYFYHNQVLESSCFADQNGDFFYTSHNDGSYIKWDTKRGSQAKANEDLLGQLYGPYPCKPTPKIQAFTGLVNDQLEDLVFFSGGMPRATYDDKNPVTIVRAESDGKDSIKTVLDFTSKVLDFVVITRPRGNLGVGAKSTGASHEGRPHGKKNKHKNQQKQEQQQQQRNNPIAVALAILAEEEFVVIDLLNSESYLEFPLPYLNCVHSSAITCNQHYSDISDELYGQLLAYNKLQLKDKLSSNEWPITGGKVIDAPELKTHDILLTGHEDGSVDFWDVSDLSMRHLLHLSTARFFSATEDDLVPIEGVTTTDSSKQQESNSNNNNQNASPDSMPAANNEDSSNQNSADNSSSWPPMKRVGRFDPYSDDTRLAIRKLSLCPQSGTLVVAGTGGQVLVFELKEGSNELESLKADEVNIVNDQRFTWKGREKLQARSGSFKFEPGYHLASYVQLNPPVAATSLDLRSDWHLYAIGTSYGFLLYEYVNKHSVVKKCTLNVQDFAIVSGDPSASANAISRKKSFRKSLRESFRRLRRGRSQRNNQPVVTGTTSLASVREPSETQTGTKPVPAFGRVLTTGVRRLGAPSSVGGAGSAANVEKEIGNTAPVSCNVYSTERQVEQKVELSSIVRCITLTSAVISNSMSFRPTLWVGTNSGQVLLYAINLASEQQAVSQQAETQPKEAAPSSGSTQVNTTAVQEAAAQPTPEEPQTSAKLLKEIQLRHRAPIIAIFTSPDAPQPIHESHAHEMAKSTPDKQLSTDLLDGDKSETSSPIKKQESGDGERDGANSPLPVTVNQEKASKKEGLAGVQPRVLICSEEQFKVFNLPSLKPFCKFKLTAHEGLRAKKISITQFLKPANVSNKTLPGAAAGAAALSSSKSLQSFATQTSAPSSPVPPADASDLVNGKQESNNNSITALNNNHTSSNTKTNNAKELMNAKFGVLKTNTMQQLDKSASISNGYEHDNASMFEPYMVCMSNQGDCAIYSVPDLKRQAQIQVCKREDVNGITSTMLTNYGEGFFLKSSTNFLRFSISSQRVLRVRSVV